MATFVLVHGAWHGGWCYRKTARILRSHGHEVFAPTLTGLGERAHLLSPDVNLDTHVTDVVNLFEAEEISDAVLCGHSYGGMVITGVAEQLPGRIKSLVYLDAYVPEGGKALLDMAKPERRDGLKAIAMEKGEGWYLPVPEGIWTIADPVDEAWVNRHVGPHPIATMLQPLAHTNPWSRVDKRVFVLAEGNPMSVFWNFAEKLRAEPDWEVVGAPCGHDVMVDMPERLAEILIDASA